MTFLNCGVRRSDLTAHLYDLWSMTVSYRIVIFTVEEDIIHHMYQSHYFAALCACHKNTHIHLLSIKVSTATRNICSATTLCGLLFLCYISE